ncbi:hypothetical protein BKA70DRAFT_1353538 [Coprinopsis sp. MPI-PUGE-AT-0042]|nr:hypothetical protein BKA70DRAFT_1353538 [Coprinopsis sp. MPI-PUGE-AT-0042]
MGAFRAYKGTGEGRAHLKGAICQTCISFNCRYTYYHGNSYVYPNFDNAVAIAGALNETHGLSSRTTPSPQRGNSQGVNNNIPNAASLPPPPVNTQAGFRSLACSTVGCSTVANRDCKDKLCKACCRVAMERARTAGSARPRCTAHKLLGVDGFAPTSTQAPPPSQVPPPPPPLASQLPLPHAPLASQLPLPHAPIATQAPSTALFSMQPPPPPMPALPATQPPPLTQGHQQPRSLANPIAEAWVAAYSNAQAGSSERKSLKAQEEHMNEVVCRTTTLVIYHTAGQLPLIIDEYIPSWPTFQLQSIDSLMDDLKLTLKSRIDIYRNGEWGTIYPTSPITLAHRAQRIVLRLRRDLLNPIRDDECPELERHISLRAGSKRKAEDDDFVSPLKKGPRKDALAIPALGPASVSCPTAPDPEPTPPSPSMSLSALPNASVSNGSHIPQARPHPMFKHTSLPSKRKGKKRGLGTQVPQFKQINPAPNATVPPTWPDDFYICDIVEGLEEVNALRARAKHIRQGEAFSLKWSTMLDDVEHGKKKEEFVQAGRVEEAKFLSFHEACLGKRPKRKGQRKPSNKRCAARLAESSDISEDSEGEFSEENQSDNNVDQLLSSDVEDVAISGPLCPFCDGPLPESPTPKCQQMLAELKAMSTANPLPGYPDHRTGLRHDIYADFCARHRCEVTEVPVAAAAGWPTSIDFHLLGEHVRTLQPTISDILEDVSESHFFQLACDAMKPGPSGKRRGDGSNVFHRQGCGYYGEQGFEIITQTLSGMFSQEDMEALSPLTPALAIQEVLVPEAAVLLISEDLGLDFEAARLVLEESWSYGINMFPAEDNSSDNEGEQDHPPVKIKEEEFEHQVPISSVVGEVIDLTGDSDEE